jgi:hypothetical protein
MKRFSSISTALLLGGIILFSCTGKNGTSPAEGTIPQPEGTGPDGSAISGIIRVSGRIVYDVEIINPYPDDQWTTECLEDLDHERLVDFIFEGIYAKRFSAYNIFEGTPVSVRKIRKMEENGEFSRRSIGKFQFQEEWILDTVNMSYTKRVREVRMGLQKFNREGELTGYAPLLRVVL